MTDIQLQIVMRKPRARKIKLNSSIKIAHSDIAFRKEINIEFPVLIVAYTKRFVNDNSSMLF